MSYLVNPLYLITTSILTYALQRVNINFFLNVKKNINSIKNVFKCIGSNSLAKFKSLESDTQVIWVLLVC
jgi:hypothetical protein